MRVSTCCSAWRLRRMAGRISSTAWSSSSASNDGADPHSTGSARRVSQWSTPCCIRTSSAWATAVRTWHSQRNERSPSCRFDGLPREAERSAQRVVPGTWNVALSSSTPLAGGSSCAPSSHRSLRQACASCDGAPRGAASAAGAGRFTTGRWRMWCAVCCMLYVHAKSEQGDLMPTALLALRRVVREELK